MRRLARARRRRKTKKSATPIWYNIIWHGARMTFEACATDMRTRGGLQTYYKYEITGVEPSWRRLDGSVVRACLS